MHTAQSELPEIGTVERVSALYRQLLASPLYKRPRLRSDGMPVWGSLAAVAPALVGAMGMAGMTPAVKRALGEGERALGEGGCWPPDGEGKGQGL